MAEVKLKLTNQVWVGRNVKEGHFEKWAQKIECVWCGQNKENSTKLN
jgi:hypothetical protein